MNLSEFRRIPGTGGRPVRLAVLLSGRGSTLQHFLELVRAGSLAASVEVVISSRTDALGLEHARRANVPAVAIPRRDFRDLDTFNDAIHATLERYPIDLVLLAGFLSPFQLRTRYQDRVLNVHPALIPAFCGKGFYGMHVHRAVVESGVKVSGCTIHFADEEYDHGPIILQECVPVLDDDTPETLATRVQEVERRLYPEAVRLWAEGRLAIAGGRVRVLPSSSHSPQ